jgi:hypothetical protein
MPAYGQPEAAEDIQLKKVIEQIEQQLVDLHLDIATLPQFEHRHAVLTLVEEAHTALARASRKLYEQTGSRFFPMARRDPLEISETEAGGDRGLNRSSTDV